MNKVIQQQLQSVRTFFRRKTKDEKGATMVEYALMVALIAIVAITGATALGTAVDTKFSAVAVKVNPTP